MKTALQFNDFVGMTIARSALLDFALHLGTFLRTSTRGFELASTCNALVVQALGRNTEALNCRTRSLLG